MIDLPRSTYYYQPKPAIAAVGDTELAHLIEDIHNVFPAMTQPNLLTSSS